MEPKNISVEIFCSFFLLADNFVGFGAALNAIVEAVVLKTVKMLLLELELPRLETITVWSCLLVY